MVNNKDWVLEYIKRRVEWVRENDLQIRNLQAESTHYLKEINQIQDEYVRAGGNPKDWDSVIGTPKYKTAREELAMEDEPARHTCRHCKATKDSWLMTSNYDECINCAYGVGHGAG